MRTSIWSGMCAVIVSLAPIAMAAQTSSALQDRSPAPPPSQERPQAPPATPQERPQAPPSAAQDRTAASDQKITITGCLTPAPPAPTGTAGSADAKADPASGETKFLLTNASASPAAAAGASAAASSAKTYRLIANETALTPHAGKKLELTGTLEDQASSSSSSSATGSSNSSTAASASNAPRLRVESGKVLSAQCAE